MPDTVDHALAEAATRIARRDAELLLGHVLGRDRTWLMMHGAETITATQQARLKELTTRRETHEPLQYLLGEQEFYGLPLRVTRDTLIPRPETEHLVEAVLDWSRTQASMSRIVDVGTGTGAIALALAKHLPDASVFACDISAAGLAVARENAERLGLGGRVQFRQSDLLSAYRSGAGQDNLFDAVVSNPPYIPSGDAAMMQPEVRDHEPHLALFAGDDGLDVYRRLIVEAHALLREDGLLAMEIGYGQREALAALLSGWKDVRFFDDYAGIPRVAFATK
ncbi:peptide chain release factor N(5)-glutamine methyltransferase [Granulicella sp. 5B5]|nr:peptide chain release factor N(5)-glutamine methyltransferase [Granulicella sp. 5B5]